MNEFQLYVDMDGVAADFDGGYERLTGIRPDKLRDDVDWDLVERTPGFFRDLEPMPDFFELWEGIAHLNPIFLTGVPKSVVAAPDNKRGFLDKVVGAHVPMIGCLSKDKCLHCKPGDVIIDDWDKHRPLWLAVGGRWILHRSARQSLYELREIMLEGSARL